MGLKDHAILQAHSQLHGLRRVKRLRTRDFQTPENRIYRRKRIEELYFTEVDQANFHPAPAYAFCPNGNGPFAFYKKPEGCGCERLINLTAETILQRLSPADG